MARMAHNLTHLKDTALIGDLPALTLHNHSIPLRTKTSPAHLSLLTHPFISTTHLLSTNIHLATNPRRTLLHNNPAPLRRKLHVPVEMYTVEQSRLLECTSIALTVSVLPPDHRDTAQGIDPPEPIIVTKQPNSQGGSVRNLHISRTLL